jgi:hypothetical protein
MEKFKGHQDWGAITGRKARAAIWHNVFFIYCLTGNIRYTYIAIAISENLNAKGAFPKCR